MKSLITGGAGFIAPNIVDSGAGMDTEGGIVGGDKKNRKVLNT